MISDKTDLLVVLQFMSDMTFDCLHQKSKSHRDQVKFDIVIQLLLGVSLPTTPFRMHFGRYLNVRLSSSCNEEMCAIFVRGNMPASIETVQAYKFDNIS